MSVLASGCRGTTEQDAQCGDRIADIDAGVVVAIAAAEDRTLAGIEDAIPVSFAALEKNLNQIPGAIVITICRCVLVGQLQSSEVIAIDIPVLIEITDGTG